MDIFSITSKVSRLNLATRVLKICLCPFLWPICNCNLGLFMLVVALVTLTSFPNYCSTTNKCQCRKTFFFLLSVEFRQSACPFSDTDYLHVGFGDLIVGLPYSGELHPYWEILDWDKNVRRAETRRLILAERRWQRRKSFTALTLGDREKKCTGQPSVRRALPNYQAVLGKPPTL